MRPLLRLAPYLRRYWKLLAAGYAAVLLSDGLAIAVPLVLRQVFNAIDADIRSAPLLGYGALVVGLTFLSGIFLFLTRQTIIVTSRKIEYGTTSLRTWSVCHSPTSTQRRPATSWRMRPTTYRPYETLSVQGSCTRSTRGQASSSSLLSC